MDGDFIININRNGNSSNSNEVSEICYLNIVNIIAVTDLQRITNESKMNIIIDMNQKLNFFY